MHHLPLGLSRKAGEKYGLSTLLIADQVGSAGMGFELFEDHDSFSPGCK
jgi:hypothetical protein